jgi:hypothetical protein
LTGSEQQGCGDSALRVLGTVIDQTIGLIPGGDLIACATYRECDAIDWTFAVVGVAPGGKFVSLLGRGIRKGVGALDHLPIGRWLDKARDHLPEVACALEIPSATMSAVAGSAMMMAAEGGGGKNKKCLPGPGEDLHVGPYRRSYLANKLSGLGKTHTAHHVLQAAVGRITRDDGITINIRKELHKLTRTFRKRVQEGQPRQHLARDIRDLRNILKDAGYDPRLIRQQLRKLIRQNREVGGLEKTKPIHPIDP